MAVVILCVSIVAALVFFVWAFNSRWLHERARTSADSTAERRARANASPEKHALL